MKRRNVLGIILLLVFVLSACDPYADRYPWFKANSWHCEEINFSISYRMDSRGTRLDDNSSLTWNDETLEVHVGYAVNYFRVGMDKNQDGILETLFKGTWKYKGDKMIFYITDDYFFDGAFTELTFVPESK